MSNYIAGKINSPMIYPKSYPLSICKANGPFIYDVKLHKYIDLWSSYGAAILGHSDFGLLESVSSQLYKGILYPAPSVLEQKLADLLHTTIPNAKSIKFATTGSEATMYAIRVARCFTKKEKVLDITGNYHGANDVLMPTKGRPSCLNSTVDYVEFNDLDAIEKHFKNEEYAALIMEPIMTNSNCILPEKNYLNSVKKLCNEYGVLLIFDEIVTGFRVSIGGAQKLYKVIPDLSTFSKAMGGGFPISAVCGKKEIMDLFSDQGAFLGGTFNANPLSLTAAIYTVSKLKFGGLNQLHKEAKQIINPIRDMVEKYDGIKISSQGPMFGIAFSKDILINNGDLKKSSSEKYAFFASLLAKRGIFLPPNHSESCFLSLSHASVSKEIIEKLISALKNTVQN
ncbi:MAG: aminotransferase class III-fold pyridoxal phosphate-dependent enzyme [Candidatus Micrarchaeota archaeon]|nr:aminotransferase class III-fold pyridoxal phosphate-dependent enzyme [Candidatus Micrarchaeota archaeon]